MNAEKDTRKFLELSREVGALKHGSFKLASGEMSSVYFDARLLSMEHNSLIYITRVLEQIIDKLNPKIDAIGGPAVGAVPLIGAYVAQYKLRGFFVRPEKKEHGTQRQIEGNLRKGDRVVMIEDTVTSGKSLIEAIHRVREYGAEVTAALVVLDRGAGAKERLDQERVPLYSLLMLNATQDDIVPTSRDSWDYTIHIPRQRRGNSAVPQLLAATTESP